MAYSLKFRRITISLFLIISLYAKSQTPIITNPAPVVFDVSSALHLGTQEEFSILSEEAIVSGVVFNNDGSKMFIIGYAGDAVVEYSLATGYDVSTAVYNGASEEFSVTAQEIYPTDLTFNSDGTKMFIVGFVGDAVVEYTLGTAYDVSSAVYAGAAEEFFVGAQELTPQGLVFNSDGTKMFIVGYGGAVVEYTLGTAYDVSTSIYAGVSEEFSVSAQEVYPTGLAFNSDGTKMYIIGNNNDSIVEYSLSTAYDVSTAVYGGFSEELAVGTEEMGPQGISFNSDGNKLFIIGIGGDAVVEYALENSVNYTENSVANVVNVDANDGQGGANDSSITYSIQGDDASLFSINASGEISFISPPDYENPLDTDGNNIYKILAVADNSIETASISLNIKVQNLSDQPVFTYIGSGYDLSTAKYAGIDEEFSVFVQESSPSSISFNLDGTKMFVLGYAGDAVVEYNLATPFDVSTAIYAGSAEELVVSSQESNPTGLDFNSDGTKLFIVGRSGDAVVEYNLATAFDVSTATYAGISEEFSVGAQENNPQDIAFNSDGSQMFIIGSSGDAVVEYNLGTNYDVSSAIYAGIAEERRVSGTSPMGLTFNSDGSNMYYTESGFDWVVQYGLSASYDASSGRNNWTIGVATYETTPEDLAFNSDGTKMFVIGSNSDAVIEYTLSSSLDYIENGTSNVIDIDANDGLGGANDISVSYSLGGDDASLFNINSAGVITFNSSPDYETPQDLDLDNTYEIVVLATNTFGNASQDIQITIEDVLGEFPLFTNLDHGFNVSNAVHTGVSEEYSVSNWESLPFDLTFAADGFKMYALGYDASVMEFDLSLAYDVSTASYLGILNEFSVTSQESFPRDLILSSDGSKMFILGLEGDAVVEYHLGTPFDVSTSTYAGVSEEFSVTTEDVQPMALTFNSDGSKMFILGGFDKSISEYDLSTSYDVSTAVYAGLGEEFSISSQVLSPQDFKFNVDGTQMFLLGSYLVYQYDLITAYDVSTASYAGTSEDFLVSTEENSPHGLEFDPAGTKMFVIGSDGDAVVEYILEIIIDITENSTADIIDIDANDGFGGANDVSVTYSLQGVDASQFSISTSGVITLNSPPDFENPLDSNFDNIYEVVVVAANTFNQSTLSLTIAIQDESDIPIFTDIGHGFDISSAEYLFSDFNVNSEENQVSDLAFNNDGTKLFILGSGGDAVVEYSLSQAYDVTTAIYLGASEEFSIIGEFNPTGLAFNNDGTKMFILGSSSTAVQSYDLATAYDVSTATYNISQLSVGTVAISPMDLAFNSDGTRLFILDQNRDVVIEYNLGTAYNMLTAVYAGSSEEFSVVNEETNPTGLVFNTDGTKMFIIGTTGDAVVEYKLHPFDISTAVYIGISEELSVFPQENTPTDLVFNSIGTKMYVIGTNSDAVVQYKVNPVIKYLENETEDVIDVEANDGAVGSNDLSVTYSLSGADASLFNINASGVVTFNSSPDFEDPQDNDINNTYEITVTIQNLYESDNQQFIVEVIDVQDFPIITNPQSFDASMFSYSGSSEEFSVALEETIPTGIAFDSFGKKMFIIGVDGDAIVEYNLGTPYDVSTAVYAGLSEEFSVAAEETTPINLAFNNNGLKMFVIGVDDDAIVEYDLVVAYDVSTAVYAGALEEFSVATEEDYPYDLTFNNDGTKMYIVGYNSGSVIEYNLANSYDVSSASYAGQAEEFSILPQDSDPRAISFNSEGTKMLIATNGRDAIIEYSLGTPFDVSTAVYAGILEELAVGSQEIYPLGMAFSNLKDKMFIIGSEGDAVVEYQLIPKIEYDEGNTSIVIDFDANNGANGANDTSVTYSLEGADASLFSLSASGVLNFLASPDFENPSDLDANNIYELSLKVADLPQETILPIQVVVINQNEVPVFTNVGEGFDVSTATFAPNTLAVTSQELFPRGIAFNSNGTKMFIVGNNGNAVVEYDLDFYDLSTATHAGASEEFSIAAQEVSVRDLAFNNIGTKMYIIGSSGDAVIEYNLTTAYDVSTAIYAGAGEEFSCSSEETNPTGFSFNNDGTKMFIVGQERSSIVEYQLGIAFDVSTATYSGSSEEFSIASEEAYPTGIRFSNDGTKVFIIGSGGDAIVEYFLASPYDVSSAVYAGFLEEFSVSPYETGPTCLTFDPTGTKMYVAGFSNSTIIEYPLASVISYDENSSVDVINIDANDGDNGANDTSVSYSLGGVDASHFSIDPSGIISLGFAPDYENPQDANSDNLFEFQVEANNSQLSSIQKIQVHINNLNDIPVFTYIGTGYDVSTAEYIGSSADLSVQNEETAPTDLFFNNDGTKLFVIGENDDAVVEYELQRNYDLSSASYLGASEEFAISWESSPSGMAFNNDGTKMYVIGKSGNSINQYDLGNPFDVSTASWIFPHFSVNSEEVAPTDFAFNSNGTKLFVIGENRATVIEYDLITAYDLSTATYSGMTEEFSVSSEEPTPTGITFNYNGTKMFIIGSHSDAMIEYSLGTAYDVSTATYAGVTEQFSVANKESVPSDVIFNSDGTQMFIVGNTHDKIIKYALASVVDYQENSSANVIDINANDGLGGLNDVSVTYSISGTDMSLFGISSSGIITFNSTPDFENPQDSNSDNIYEVTFTAANVLHQVSQKLAISVIDVNETPSTYFIQEFNIQENSTEVFYSVKKKEGFNYSFGNQKDESLFKLTGNGISFTSAPDFENPEDLNGDNKYLIDLMHSDSLGYTTKIELSVNVLDIDDYVLNVSEIDDVVIYPNPVNDSFIIMDSQTNIDKILLKNLNGNTVKEFVFIKDAHYDISEIKEGIYLLFFQVENVIIPGRKLMKLR